MALWPNSGTVAFVTFLLSGGLETVAVLLRKVLLIRCIGVGFSLELAGRMVSEILVRYRVLVDSHRKKAIYLYYARLDFQPQGFLCSPSRGLVRFGVRL